MDEREQSRMPPEPQAPPPQGPQGPEIPPVREPSTPPPRDPDVPPVREPEIPPVREPETPPPRDPEPPPSPRGGSSIEPPELPIDVPRSALTSQSRRAFLLFAAGTIAAAAGAWWLIPDATKRRLAPGGGNDRLDTLAARIGLSRANRERVLNGALTFDDDVAEALYSTDRRVRTYDRSQVTLLRNNYNGQTPGAAYLSTWALTLTGLASGATERLTIDDLVRRFPHREQVTRLVCVEGWSAVAWWGGLRFADLLAAFPPAAGARWASLRSSVNLDPRGNPDPYYVSIDLGTARHPQTLLATHKDGRPLPRAHGAPLRLLAPMKLGLKNIKAITDIAYTAEEPADYWNEQGYSKYDGL